MEYITKKIFCRTLNKEVVSTFYISTVKKLNGYSKIRAVDYYECQGKEECGDSQILDCSCLKEAKVVEWEINNANPSSPAGK